jgi:hypothetical protein
MKTKKTQRKGERVMRKLGKLFLTLLITGIFAVGCFSSSALAIEGKAGEVIRTMQDIQDLRAKGLLLESQVVLYGELVRDFGRTIPIVETSDRSIERTYSKGAIEATRRNKGKASIGPDDLLVNYGGQGIPFPDVTPDDPKAGLKAAFNYDKRCVGDDFLLLDWEYPLTDGKGNIKSLGGWSQNLNYSFRTDVDPKPHLVPGEEHLWFKNVIGFHKPFSSKGLSQLVFHYVNQARDNDIWMYIPGLRRTTRVGGGNTCDCLGGFVFNLDDSNAWAGNTANFNWKLLEVRELLVNALITDYDFNRNGGAWVKGAHHTLGPLERRKLWMIEQTSKAKEYCYSKRIMFIDPECWWWVYNEMYDRAGTLWKELDQRYMIFKNPESTGGGGIINTIDGDAVDLKIWEAGPYWIKDIPFNKGLSPDIFTLDYLRRAGR